MLDRELVEALANVIGCDVAECPPAKCFCRKQAGAIRTLYDLKPKATTEARCRLKWSQERLGSLKDMVQGGVPQPEIGRRMGLSMSEIRTGLKYLGLLRPRPGRPPRRC